MTDEPKPEIEKQDPPPLERQLGFGRLIAIDPRDRRFMMQRVESARTYRYWNAPSALDQSDTPQCVAFSATAWLMAGPVANRELGEPPAEFAHKLYADCQRNDEWDGEGYEGTSVRASAKVMKARGYIPEYRWATSAEVIANHILEVGPVMVGTWWREGMMVPEEQESGLIHPTGAYLGGHAWLLTGFNREKSGHAGHVIGPCFRLQNSWGLNWGDRGRAWITLPELQELIDDEGEACTATEVDLDPKRGAR